MAIFRSNLFTLRRGPTRLLPRSPVLHLQPPQSKPAMLLVNGIFSSPGDWQIPLTNWGNANAASYSWSYFAYDADAILTGLWLNQHADALAAAIAKLLDGGAPSVDLICHSEGNEVAVRAMQRNHSARVRNFNAVAAAMYSDCRGGWCRNGLNDLLLSGQIAGQVRCFTSLNDGVLGGPPQWLTPYFWGKKFGLTGPTNGAPEAAYLACADQVQTHLSWMSVRLLQKIVAMEEAAR